jgi:hypothetical protein
MLLTVEPPWPSTTPLRSSLFSATPRMWSASSAALTHQHFLQWQRRAGRWYHLNRKYASKVAWSFNMAGCNAHGCTAAREQSAMEG